MRFKLICLFILLTGFMAGFAQEVDVTNVARVTILNPGLSYETRVGRFQTVYGQAFMNLSASYSYSSSMGSNSEFYFDPAATLQYRYYYNGGKRMEMEKRTEMNSMNYVAVISEVIFSKMRLTSDYFDESGRRGITRFGVAWGLQRNYKSRFSLDLNLGLGYMVAKGTTYNYSGQLTTRTITTPTMMGQFNIGFWLNREKEE
ncbi:MAG TPA: hypothetical protein VL095_13685 [Flavisolibacter sp.]|nr:hypothetical protein [Flavisolibacter sp.]